MARPGADVHAGKDNGGGGAEGRGVSLSRVMFFFGARHTRHAHTHTREKENPKKNTTYTPAHPPIQQDYEGRDCDITIMPWAGHIGIVGVCSRILSNPSFQVRSLLWVWLLAVRYCLHASLLVCLRTSNRTMPHLHRPNTQYNKSIPTPVANAMSRSTWRCWRTGSARRGPSSTPSARTASSR